LHIGEGDDLDRAAGIWRKARVICHFRHSLAD
jgi:hypothetical protein